MNIMSPETAFEPETALKAEDGGLEFYKAITEKYKNSLKAGGRLCFEVGFSQKEAVSKLLIDTGFSDVQVKNDLNGIGRAVSGIKN